VPPHYSSAQFSSRSYEKNPNGHGFENSLISRLVRRVPSRLAFCLAMAVGYVAMPATNMVVIALTTIHNSSG
jgi:hypothetical protein